MQVKKNVDFFINVTGTLTLVRTQLWKWYRVFIKKATYTLLLPHWRYGSFFCVKFYSRNIRNMNICLVLHEILFNPDNRGESKSAVFEKRLEFYTGGVLTETWWQRRHWRELVHMFVFDNVLLNTQENIIKW